MKLHTDTDFLNIELSDNIELTDIRISVVTCMAEIHQWTMKLKEISAPKGITCGDAGLDGEGQRLTLTLTPINGYSPPKTKVVQKFF